MAQVEEQQFSELAKITADLETALRTSLAFDKINYLALMMVDKHVHFHVIPRYAQERRVCGLTFIDPSWPKPPLLTQANEISDAQFRELREILITHWPPL